MALYRFSRLALFATGSILASSAVAQTATENRPNVVGSELDQEIVVTAARQRLEPAQQAPIATTVLTLNTLKNAPSSDITAIAQSVPNLIIQESNNVVGLPSISLRGFNSKSSDIAAEPGVAIYIDGVYQTIQPGSLANTFDLAALEVLRGPQGTLLGRNAPAGAILLTRTRPTGKLGAEAEIEYGSYNLVQGQALLNFPIISEVLAGKVFGSYRRRDGYIDNLITGKKEGKEDVASMRAALLFTPSSDFTGYLTADYMRNRSEPKPIRNIARPDTASCAIFGFCNIGGGLRNVTSADFNPPVRQDDYSATLVMDWNLGPVAVRATTGYRNYKSTNNNDLDGTPAVILHAFDNKTELESISQEIRFNSVDGAGLDLGGRLNWVVGAYFADSKGYYSQALNAFGGASVTNQAERVNRRNYAVFGQADFKIIDAWSIQFGVRRSDDKVDHRFSLATPITTYPFAGPKLDTPFEERASFPRTSIEAGTQYKFSKSKMAFFRFSEGYLAGSFVGLPTTIHNDPILPETSKSYEVGIKTDWLDHALRVNLVLFDAKYKNHQVSVVQGNATVGLVQVPANADIDTKGIELEMVVKPSKRVTARTSFGYLDAKYGSFIVNLGNGQTQNVTGQQIPLAPKYTINMSGDYTIPIGGEILDNVKLNGNISLVSDTQTSFNGGAIGIQDGYSTSDISISFNSPGDRFSFTGYVNNVGNKYYIQNTQVLAGLVDFVQDNIGRTWGIRARAKF